MKLVLLGANYRSTPIALRETLALPDEVVVNSAKLLQQNAVESVILSTCNRLEMYALCENDDWFLATQTFFAQTMGVDLAESQAYVYQKQAADAASHLMRVASSLDSMVLGENEILGQVRSALVLAEKTQTVGPVLRRLFELAVHAGKRARTETAISQSTTSASHVALQLIHEHLLQDPGRLLVIGAGESARLAVQASVKCGFNAVCIVNRTLEHAQELAAANNCLAAPWDQLETELTAANSVICAIQTDGEAIPTDLFDRVIAKRQGRGLTLVDLSVPRNIPAAWGEQPGVHLYSVDDLASVVQAGMAKRQAEVPAVEKLIIEEQHRFWLWLDNRQKYSAQMAVNGQAAPASISTDSVFLKACQLQPVKRIPVWFMRQAGRYMAAYRELRQEHSLLEMIKDPALACEVTMQPIRAYDLDAAIIFSDILPPLQGMGLDLEFLKGEGPVFHNPVKNLADIERLQTPAPEEALWFTLEAIRKTVKELAPKGLPLIGFCGAPFTLASYAVEGAGSKDKAKTKALMRGNPEAWQLLMTKLAKVTGDFLVAQVQAGAQALQIFDSWVGELSPQDYRQFVQPYSRLVLDQAKATGVPVIHFGTNTGGFLEDIRDAGGSVIGVDWRIDIQKAATILGSGVAIQGNLDPSILLSTPDQVLTGAKHILDAVGSRPGFIFNVGHGITKETPEERITQLIDIVHAHQVR